MNTRDLRRDARDRVCRARAVARVVESPAFEEAWERAAGEARARAALLVRSLDKDGLDAWIAGTRPEGDLGALTLRQLRIKGQRLGIRGYHILPKAILLSEIANATKRLGQAAPQAP